MIELLIVIAIIGLLAALLLPALGLAKERARQVSCLNRLKQWNLALVMYKDENDDFLPRESFIPGGTTLNFWAQVQNALARDVWYNALPPLIGQIPASHYTPMALRGNFYGRDKLMHCPSASFPPGADQSAVAYFSVAMNSELIRSPNATVKFSSIQKPSATVTFLDNRLPGEPKADPSQPDDDLGQPSAFANRFVARHLQRGTLVFADGHYECLPPHEVMTNGYAIIPQVRIIWTTDPAIDPNTAQ